PAPARRARRPPRDRRSPPAARLPSIAPSVQKGEIVLEVLAVVRSPEVGWQFWRTLEDSGDFESVFPLSEGENGEFRYTMRYRPHGSAPGEPAASPDAAPPSGAPAAGPAETTSRPPEATPRPPASTAAARSPPPPPPPPAPPAP